MEVDGDADEAPATSAEILQAIEQGEYNSEEDEDFVAEDKDEDDDAEFAGLVVEEEGIPVVKVAPAASTSGKAVAGNRGAGKPAGAVPPPPAPPRQSVASVFAAMKAADAQLVASRLPHSVSAGGASPAAPSTVAPQLAVRPVVPDHGWLASLHRADASSAAASHRRGVDPTTQKKVYLLKGLSSREAPSLSGHAAPQLPLFLRRKLARSAQLEHALTGSTTTQHSTTLVGGSADGVVPPPLPGTARSVPDPATAESQGVPVAKRQRVALSEEAIALAAKAKAMVSQVKVAVSETVKFAGKTVEYVVIPGLCSWIVSLGRCAVTLRSVGSLFTEVPLQ